MEEPNKTTLVINFFYVIEKMEEPNKTTLVINFFYVKILLRC